MPPERSHAQFYSPLAAHPSVDAGFGIKGPLVQFEDRNYPVVRAEAVGILSEGRSTACERSFLTREIIAVPRYSIAKFHGMSCLYASG